MKGVTIRVMASASDEEIAPLFVGRDDGTIEKYISIEDADLGKPSLILRGHRGPITGLVVVHADEVFSSSLDGSIKQWNAAVELPYASPSSSAAAQPVEGGRRVLRSLDGPVPLHCLAQQPSNGRLYAGGADGALHVIDGDRRSTWPGHLEPITCIAFTLNDLVVTGGADHQVLVWDSSQGKPFRLLQGHKNAITGIAVVPADEDALDAEEEAGTTRYGLAEMGPNYVVSPAGGAIVSFAKDGTAKVWTVPDPQADEDEAAVAGAEALALSPENSTVLDGSDAGGSRPDSVTHADSKRNTATVVSFQMPADSAAGAAGADGSDGEGAAATAGEHKESEEYHRRRQSFEATPIMTIALTDENLDGAATADGEEAVAPVPPEVIAEILNAPTNIKSALKAPERPLLRRDEALGTIEFPAMPFAVHQPSTFADEDAMDDEDGSGLSDLVLVGSLSGSVWGLRLPDMAKTVLRFVADNRRRVSQEVRANRTLLRQSEALTKKECRKAVKTETDKQVRIAKKAHNAKRKVEKEKKRDERQAAAREAAEARRANPQYSDEEDEEGYYEEEEDEEEDEEFSEEEEDAFTEPAEDGEDARLTMEQKHRAFKLRHLTPEQRTALDAFVAEKEKTRDEKIAALKAAVEAHLAAVKPLAKTTYDRSKDQFARLNFTSYASVAPCVTLPTVGGTIKSAVLAARSGDAGMEGEVVLAVLQSRGRVYASQGDRVSVAKLMPGVVKL